MEKKCTACGESKPLDDFHRNSSAADGHCDRCKDCANQKRRDYYWSDPEKSREQALQSQQRTLPRVLAYNREYAHKHPEKVRKWNSEGRKRNIQTHMLVGARQRAKVRNTPFTITKQDIVIPEVCPVLGIPIQLGEKHSRDNSPSLDAIVPALGYVPGNIAVISHKANTMKSNATPAELRAVADWIEKMTA